MKDYPYNSDEPTQPFYPKNNQAYPNLPQDAKQQDKLIIGNFQDEPQRPARHPYQNPNAQQPYREPPTIYPQYPVPPMAPQPPGRGAASDKVRPVSRKKPRRRRGCLIGCLVVLVLLCVVGSFLTYTAQRVIAFGKAISTQDPLSTQTNYMGTSDRVNLLVLGYGGGTHDGANLTDSMMVISLLPQSHHTTLLSVPRDLWVQYPPSSGNYTKINAVYEFASNNGQNPVDGGNAATTKVSLVTGLTVKYWLTINFDGFRKFIDSIGGIDVTVPDTFNACYPKNDDANKDPSWITVQFNKGTEHMNGERAIEFARAREPMEVCGQGTSINLAELTDFGRSARQQIIIKAALTKVKQMSTWPSLFNALTALESTIYTNLSLADLAQFALKMDLNSAHRVGLSNANVLVDATSNDGQYILLPRNDDWQGIIDYVKQQLYN